MWTFYDFVDASGENVIDAWLRGLTASHPMKVRARLDAKVTNLQQMRRNDWGDLIGPMKGREWHKIFELRFTFQNVQYRPLLCHVPDEQAITLLVGATEKGGQILPRQARDQAQERRVLIESNIWRDYVVRHDET